MLRADFSTLTRGTMWINGHNLGRFPEKIPIKSIYLPECWLKDGVNELVVLDETGASVSDVKLLVEAAANREVIRRIGIVAWLDAPVASWQPHAAQSAARVKAELDWQPLCRKAVDFAEKTFTAKSPSREDFL